MRSSFLEFLQELKIFPTEKRLRNEKRGNENSDLRNELDHLIERWEEIINSRDGTYMEVYFGFEFSKTLEGSLAYIILPHLMDMFEFNICLLGIYYLIMMKMIICKNNKNKNKHIMKT